MSHGKQFTLFTHRGGGPNGWKVVVILEELGLSYESEYLEFPDMKKPEYTQYNPNGRIPAIIDHKNDNFVLWESNAIIQYLVDKYDTEHRISAPDGPEKYQQLQWLYFQASGQGPYFGQLAWFLLYHPEKIQSAIDRYKNEIIRVFGVLEEVLSKREWLVGDKMTVADLSFVPWSMGALTVKFLTDHLGNLAEQFPVTAAWHQKMMELPSVKRMLAERAKILEKPAN